MPVLERERTKKRKTSLAGWIDWHPGPPMPPLPNDTIVDVRLRSDTVREEMSVGNVFWGSTGTGDSEVVSYRVRQGSESDPGWMPHDSHSQLQPPPYAAVRVKYRVGMITDPFAVAKIEWGERDDTSDYEVVAYKIVDGALEIPWFPTERAQCPLPDARVRIRLRNSSTVDGCPGAPGSTARSWTWSGGGKDKSAGDILAYVITNPSPDGMMPHSPTSRSECPVPPRSRVFVQTRAGGVGAGRADSFTWTHNIRDRDSEIVAWRPA